MNRSKKVFRGRAGFVALAALIMMVGGACGDDGVGDSPSTGNVPTSSTRQDDGSNAGKTPEGNSNSGDSVTIGRAP
ncbi:MAG: hypothetical protein ABI658_32075 [Acidimicrobiales bacterium]